MKKLLYLIIAIIVIVVIILLCNTENKNKENAILVNGNVVENNKEYENKIIENVVGENIIKNEEIEENTTENTIENTIDTETFEEEPKTEQDKAKSIVKKDWGNDSNIEITVDGMNNNGLYIVTVRDSKTTEALAFYTVNTKDGTFNKKEMN